jgi:hypothetical protein
MMSTSIVSFFAKGHADSLRVIYSLTTALYPSHSPFLGTDPVFATKKSLVSDVTEEKDPKKWAEMGFRSEEVKTGRVWVWRYSFVLASNEEVNTLKNSTQTNPKL